MEHKLKKSEKMLIKQERDRNIIKDYTELMITHSSMKAQQILKEKYGFKDVNSVGYILYQNNATAKYKRKNEIDEKFKLQKLELDEIFLTGLEQSTAKFNTSDFNKNFDLITGWSFVYMLRNNGEIIYIGLTSSLLSRISNHKHDKTFTDVVLIHFKSKEVAIKMETYYIHHYNPILNRTVSDKNSRFLGDIIRYNIPM